MWAWLALRTPRYRFYIYSEDYGQEYENLVGKSYSEELTDSELERMTEECLTENPYITGIENFSCVKQEEKITLTFRLITEVDVITEDLSDRGSVITIKLGAI